MDDNFEEILLDEEDDLNYGIESLREKAKNSVRDSNNKNYDYNKDVINLIKNEENHINPSSDIKGKNNIINNDEDEKNLSEEYNDFEYNIEENVDIGDKSPGKIKNKNKSKNSKDPLFVIDANDNLYESSSNSGDKIGNINNNNIPSEKEIIDNNQINNDSKNGENLNSNRNNFQESEYIENIENIENNDNDNDNENYKENEENINNDNDNYQYLQEEKEEEKKEDENENENEIEINKEKELIKNSSSMIQMIEDNYYITKNELENILSKLEFNSAKEITNQNIKLIDYISKLNSMINQRSSL